MGDTMSEVLDLIAVPAFVIDVLDGDVVVFNRLNKAHEAMTGMRTAEIAGKAPAELFPQRLAQTLTDNYLRVVSSREAYSYEEMLDLSRGEEWWQTTLMPILGEDGAVVRIIGTAVNISVQKRAEIDWLGQVARAHALNEDVEETLALAAHDLRSPLQNMQAMVRMLKKDFVDLNDGKLAILQSMEKIGAGAARFVEEMLTYRETAGVTPIVSRFDLGHVCSDIVALLDPMSRHLIHYNHIEIESDVVALQIVVRNLVDNALSHAGRRELMIAVDVAEAQPGVLTFTVADNGHGIGDPRALQGGDAGQEDSQKAGRGYGLRGVRRLVRSRGGEVWASEPVFSSGTTIQFTLPGHILGERTAAAARRAA